MNLLKLFMYGGVLEVFVIPHILPYVTSCVPTHITDMIQLTVAIISGLFPHVLVNMQSEVFLKVWNEADAPVVANNTNVQRETVAETIAEEGNLCERHRLTTPGGQHSEDDEPEYRSRIASKLYPDDCDPRIPDTCEMKKYASRATKCGPASANQMIYSMAMRQMSGRVDESRVTDLAIFGSQQNVLDKTRDGRSRPAEGKEETRAKCVVGQVIGRGSGNATTTTVQADFARSCSLGFVTKFQQKDVDDKCPISEARDKCVDVIDDAPQRAASCTQAGRPSSDCKWKAGEVKENEVSFRNPSSPRKTSKNENDTAAGAVYFGSNFRNL